MTPVVNSWYARAETATVSARTAYGPARPAGSSSVGRHRRRPALRRPGGSRSQGVGPPGRRCPRTHPARPAASVGGRRHRHRDLGQPVEADLDPTGPGRQRRVGGDHARPVCPAAAAPTSSRRAGCRDTPAVRRRPRSEATSRVRSVRLPDVVARASTGPLALAACDPGAAGGPFGERRTRGRVQTRASGHRPDRPLQGGEGGAGQHPVHPQAEDLFARPVAEHVRGADRDRRRFRWPGQLGGSHGHRDLTGGSDRQLPERGHGGHHHVDRRARPGQRGEGDLQHRGVPDPEPIPGRRQGCAHAAQRVLGARQRSIQAAAASVEERDERPLVGRAGQAQVQSRRDGITRLEIRSRQWRHGPVEHGGPADPTDRVDADPHLDTETVGAGPDRLGQHRQRRIRGRRRRRCHAGGRRPAASHGRLAQQPGFLDG